MEHYPLAISVPRAELARNWLDRHNTYLIEVDDCGKIYTCQRRYTNFVWLHAELRRRDLPCALPELPPKKALGKLEDTFVERRRQSLEDYLQALLKLPAVVQDDSLWTFLDADLATAVVPRFLCRPQAHVAAGESLRQLERVASVASSIFRMCSPAVLGELVSFVRAEAAEPMPSMEQKTNPAQQREQQARSVNRLKLCSVLKVLIQHERARQGLVEAGAFSSLLSLLRRATEDAEAVPASVTGDPRTTTTAAVAGCLRGFLESTKGQTMLDFCQQDDGFSALQPLAEVASLHAIGASLLWHGFQNDGVVLAFASNSASGLPLLGKLLRSPDLCARLLAALCVCCLVRHEGALDVSSREFCIEALEPIVGGLDESEEEALQRAAAASLQSSSAAPATAPDHDGPLAALLRTLCSEKEIHRLHGLLASPASLGAEVGMDGVAALIVAVLDHFVRQNMDDPARRAPLAPLAPILQRLVDVGAEENGWTVEGDYAAAGAAGEARVRAARVVLYTEGPCSEGNAAREPPGFQQFAQRFRMLNALSHDADHCRQRTVSRLETLNEYGQQQIDLVGAGGLTEQLCLGHKQLADFAERLSNLEQRRDTLSRSINDVKQARSNVMVSLDNSGVRHKLLSMEVDKFLEAVGSKAELETRSSHALAEARGCEEVAQAAMEQQEALSSELREAEATAAQKLSAARREGARASMLKGRAEELTEICHNAPAQLERLQARLAEAGHRKSALSESALAWAAEKDRKERSAAGLRESEKEAVGALKNLAAVKSELQEFRSTLQSELILSEKEVQRLQGMELRLQPQRPLRLRRGSEPDGNNAVTNAAALGSTGSCETSLTPQAASGPLSNEGPGGSPPNSICEEGGEAPAPPSWDGAQLDQEFRDQPQFRTFARLCAERERLWMEEMQWLRERRMAEEEAAKVARQKCEAEHGEVSALEEEEQQLHRDVIELSDQDGHALRRQEACAAAAEAHEAALVAASESTEASGSQNLLETRLEKARAEVRVANEALAAARETAGVESNLLSQACSELHKLCTGLESRSRSSMEEWRVVELEERQVGLLQEQVALRIHEESQGRAALRAEVRRISELLAQLDLQLQADQVAHY